MEELKVFLEDVRSKGWEPAGVVISQHGDDCCAAHIYAMRQAEGEWQYGYFRYSTNHKVLSDQGRVFASRDQGRKNFRDLVSVFLYRVPHVVLKKEEFAA